MDEELLGLMIGGLGALISEVGVNDWLCLSTSLLCGLVIVIAKHKLQEKS